LADSRDITAQLKQYARQIGLAGLAVGPAEPYIEAACRLKQRIERGFAGHYGLIQGSEERFCRPDLVIDGARSVISCALSYLRPADDRPPDSQSPRGVVARFARGKDYHKVLNAKLEMVAAKLIELCPGAVTRIIVDTGPLLDRAAASQCGLGWYGKNACIFTGESGSWVVLGEIVTDAELAFDLPQTGHKCGSCELCLSACPTGAIAAPFEINLNLCISHLTQMGGIVPRELRPLMGVMIYGCDICQEVCPQNEGVQPGRAEDFEPGPMPARPDLIELVNISNADFNTSIKRSAAGWIGRNRLRRNAIIALGNLKNPDAAPALKNALRSRSGMIRAHAAWALGRLGPEQVPVLESRLRYEDDPDVILELQQALVEMNQAL